MSRCLQKFDDGDWDVDVPIDHDYLSAGDTPYADGDRCYSGCFLCGQPRSKHRDYTPKVTK